MDFSQEEKQVFKKMGQKSANVRFQGMTKEQISEKMKELRAKRKTA